MNSSSNNTSIGQAQRIILLLSSFLLAIVLFLYRGGLNSPDPLDQLARKSLDPEIALKNGRPSVFEFYADWCEACKEMAPAMLSIENSLEAQIDIVLLNVENNRWDDLINKYSVQGIPQLNFFDANGNFAGTSIGLKSYEELEELINNLLMNKVISSSDVIGKVSNLDH